MFDVKKNPVLITGIICLEAAIYLWASYTATLQSSNYFSIEPEFIFNKCARNSGRVSSALNLIILLFMGYYTFSKIHADILKKNSLKILISLFAINHLIHFFFVYQNFQHHALELRISENLHGFITFISVLIIPMLLWMYAPITKLLFIGLLIHLANVSYFICETFYNKITPEKPAYHNQFGILITTIALLYMLIKVMRDLKMNTSHRY